MKIQEILASFPVISRREIPGYAREWERGKVLRRNLIKSNLIEDR